MKNLLILLLSIGMMAGNTSAQAQMSDDLFNMVIANWAPALKADPKAINEIRTALTSSDAKVQMDCLNKYTVLESVDFKHVTFLHPTDAEATSLKRLTVSDTNHVNVLLIKLDKLNENDPSLVGKTIPFMAFDEESNQPYFVLGYELKDKQDAVAETKESESEPMDDHDAMASVGKPKTTNGDKNRSNVNGNHKTTSGDESQSDANGNGGSGQGEYKVLPNGMIVGPGFYSYPDGTTFVQQADGKYAELKAKNKSQKELDEQAAQQAAISDTALQKASYQYQMTVSQRGNPDLLANAGVSGGGSGQKSSYDPNDPNSAVAVVQTADGKRTVINPNSNWVLEDRVEMKHKGRNDVQINHHGDGKAETDASERSTKNLQVRYGYDNDSNPTSATNDRMSFGGFLRTIFVSPTGERGYYDGGGAWIGISGNTSSGVFVGGSHHRGSRPCRTGGWAAYGSSWMRY
jgi:hypothetical protein